MNAPVSALALQRIQENQEKHARGEDASFLDLGNCGLKQLPQELFALQHLTALNLGALYVDKVNALQTPHPGAELALRESQNKGEPNLLYSEEIGNVGFDLPIRHLYLTGLHLKSIAGLNRLYDLESLYLGNNDLTDISPLQPLVKLQDLFLVQNHITDIRALQGLKALRSLNLSRNRISDLAPIAGCLELNSLLLGNNAVTELAPLAGLTALKQLIAFENNIRSVEPLSNLSELEKVHLAANQIGDIGPLKGWTKIRELKIHQNQIEDITPLAGLTSLIILSASENRITRLPESFNWPLMTQLYLENNHIQHLPPLKPLAALEVLNLSNNGLSDLSPLQDLSLSNLDLSSNQIEDITPLKTLCDIKSLNLENNAIKALAPLANAFRGPATIRLANNPIQDIPLEIVHSNSSEAIDAYFKDLENQADFVAEVKLILVGNSTSGKTTLSKILRNKPFDKDEKSTHGIQIHQWKINKRDVFDADEYPEAPEKVIVNIWDFGGQEYYHGTHQLFLDNNAIYLLIWESQTNRSAVLDTEYSTGEGAENKMVVPVEHFNFQYWLDSIRFYASGQSGQLPPIFMIQNKLDKENGKVSWPDPYLLQAYEVNECLALSTHLARSKSSADRIYNHRFQIFRDKLLSAIYQKAIENVQRDRLPAFWHKVREAIREATDRESSQRALTKNPFFTRADESQSLDGRSFREACREAIAPVEINEQQMVTLVSYLNSVGALYYNPAVEDRLYLRPTLLTEKIYQVLNQDVLQRKGRFTQHDTATYFSAEHGETEQRRKASVLTDLMARWEIIFPAPLPTVAPSSALPAAPAGGSPEANNWNREWIAAQYLPDEHPLEGLYQIASSGLERCYVLRCPLFHYKKAMRQLLISFGNDSRVGNKEFWKNGILFGTREENLRVLIKGVREENVGKIKVYVEQRPGNEAATRRWEALIFEEIIKATTENVRQNATLFYATGRSGEGTEAFARRAEKAALFGLSRNESDFVLIRDLLQQAQNGAILVPAAPDDGKRGSNVINIKGFEPFLATFGQKAPSPTIFFSYSHDNSQLRAQLETYLGPIVKRLKQAEAWYDGQIMAGELWDEAIKSRLRQADVVLLLISAEFINSDYIWKNELLPALERHKRGEARVIPILLSDCLWQDLPFAELEMVPKEPEYSRLLPVTEWPNPAKAFTVIARRIQEVLEEMKIL